MNLLIVSTAVCFILAEQGRVNGVKITCASCSGASSVENCRANSITCNDDEECYLEKYTSLTLDVAFYAGCRSYNICVLQEQLSMGHLGKRAGSQGLLNCAGCCDADPDEYGACNLKLCGQRPSALSAMCLKCPGVHHSASSCKLRDTCQDTQLCSTSIHVINGLIRYEYGCEEKHLCVALLNNKNNTVTRRGNVAQGVTICDACCRGNECNKEDCFSLYKKMTPTSLGVVPTTGLPP